MCIEPPRPVGDAVLAPEQLGHDLVGVGAARERVAVRAVGGDQVVLVAHRADGADDRRLLADREVQEAADLRLRVHLARALLEAADEHHRLEPLARGVGVGQLALLGALLLLLRGVGHWVPGTLAVDPPRLPLPYPVDSHAHILGRLHRRSPAVGMAAARPPASSGRRGRRTCAARGAWARPRCATARVGAARLFGALPVPARIVAKRPGRSWTWRVGLGRDGPPRRAPRRQGCEVADRPDRAPRRSSARSPPPTARSITATLRRLARAWLSSSSGQ